MFVMQFSQFIGLLVPEKSTITHKEILITSTSAFIGVAMLAYVSSLFVSGMSLPILVGSMGAASVLLFAAPSSPMSKPWAVFGGNVVSALVGVTCSRYIGDIHIAAALAVSISILLMYYLRCLHPPGGASALVAVIGGPSIQSLGYSYSLAPVGLNVLLLLLFSFVLNTVATRRKHFILQGSQDQSVKDFLGKLTPFSKNDLTAALQDLDTYYDISQQDLSEIFSLALLHSKIRDVEHLQCKDVMTENPITFEFGSELENAWIILHKNNLDNAPVIDSGKHLIGILSIADFIDCANIFDDLPRHERLAKLIKRTPGFHSDKPEVVGQIMTTDLTSVRATAAVSELVTIFSDRNIKQVPVLSKANKLVGVITKDDLIKLMA